MANINISINTVRQALTDLMTDDTIDQAGYDIILWYYNHCQSQGFSQKQAAHEIGKSSWTTLYRVWTGKYGAGYDAIIKEISKFKDLYEKRAKLARVDYIETSIYEAVSSVCDNALIGQEISTINGNTQIGKSEALKHYIKCNPDLRIVYLELPSCPCKSLFFTELATACSVSYKLNTTQLRRQIKSSFTPKTLLILDEFHQVFLSTEKAAIAIVEFVREIYNHSHCGVVLVGTDVLDEHMVRGKNRKIFAQTIKRGLIHAQLPTVTPNADLKLAASRFGYPDKITPEARKLVKQLNEAHGLGVILQAMKRGATLAKKRNEKPTWPHFMEAWVILQELSLKPKEEK